MTETTPELPPIEERPLVTFALFAYNQEKYIREAVEGAFAQTYEPLEIILSDDCSTDRTFEIMEEMAAGYGGSHKLIVRRNKANRGLGLHIKDVVDISNGEILVVAAGDDISLCNRTDELVAKMIFEKSVFAASNFNSMNESSVILEKNLQNDYSGNYIWSVIDAPTTHFANGAAAAYSINFLRGALNDAKKALASGHVFNEDILFAAYAVAIDETPSNVNHASLLNYRIVSSSLSNFKKINGTWVQELKVLQREVFRSATRLACLRAILEMGEKHPRLACKLRLDVIRSDMRRSEVEISASSQSFLERISNARNARDATELKIFLVRIPGLKVLAALRFLKTTISTLSLKRKVHRRLG